LPFIAGTINSTAKVESKTERIQLIVKSAGRHPSVTGLTWEEVGDDLNQPRVTGLTWEEVGDDLNQPRVESCITGS
jgi:hypothetical protein